MAVLLIADVNEGHLATDAMAKTLTAVKGLGDVHVLVAGKDCAAAADSAAKLDGVAKVLVADADNYANALAEPLAALIVSLAPNFDAIVAAATTTGKNVLPRVAALLDVMQVSEIIKVVAPDTFERPIYAGNAIQTVKTRDAKKVITVRTASFQAVNEAASPAPVEAIAAGPDAGGAPRQRGGRFAHRVGAGRCAGPALS